MNTRIAAIVLAAGRSSRMGHFKLLAEVAGAPMLMHAVRAALASRARPVIVVTGNQASEVAHALAGLSLTVVDNPDYASGLASSLKTGARAVPADCAGALILLGDMPQVTSAHIDRLLAAFAPGRIVVPVHDGRRGNPVLWPRELFPHLLTLEGDAGAKRLLQEFADRVSEVEIADTAIFLDIDTPDALAELRKNAP
jgi:molybdenum cofactor cytidylyltransferase